MKISGFLAVVEKFWVRANLFFPEEHFANEVKRLSHDVRMALAKQLSIEFRNDADLPPDAEMGPEAMEALKALCQYLDEKDSGIGYWNLAYE